MFNKAKRFTAAIIGAATLLGGLQVMANEPVYPIRGIIVPPIGDIGDGWENGEEIPNVPRETFEGFEGIITEINEVGERIYVHVKNSDDMTTVFVKDFTTFVLGNDLAVGDTVTGYHDTTLAAPAIWPPMYTARLLVNGDFGNIIIERFNIMNDLENALISESGDFILRFDSGTPILLQDGQDIRKIVDDEHRIVPEGSLINPLIGYLVPPLMSFLDGRLMVVTYGPTTRSMPPQTIPGIDEGLAIHVLFELAVHLPGFGISLDIDFEPDFGTSQFYQVDEPLVWTYNYGISVEGRMVDALWQEVDGAYYVPFRAVVNLLRFGNTVTWDNETRGITVHNGTDTIGFAVDSNVFKISSGKEVTLSHPAIIFYDTTYVPFQFFTLVFGVNNAYMHEGQIVIAGGEVMY